MPRYIALNFGHFDPRHGIGIPCHRGADLPRASKSLFWRMGKIFARRAINFRAMHSFAVANGCDFIKHVLLCALRVLCGLCVKFLS
jgi:hypothetical protein